MPLPAGLARFNKNVANPLLRHVHVWTPGFGVVHHRGRVSGRTYDAPVRVLVRDGTYVIPLAYGSSADWVRNVVAAGGCDLTTRRRLVHLSGPRIFTGDGREAPDRASRLFLTAAKITEFMELTGAPGTA